MAFRFEDLEVHGRAEDCSVMAHAIAHELPANERFNLASQVRRAALSVVLNIAESTERRSPRDAAHFVEVALGSAVEVISSTPSAGVPPPGRSPHPEQGVFR